MGELPVVEELLAVVAQEDHQRAVVEAPALQLGDETPELAVAVRDLPIVLGDEPIEVGRLLVVAAGIDGLNGVYANGGGFPDQSYQSSNYWVDVVFTTGGADTTRPTVSSISPAAGATGVASGGRRAGSDRQPPHLL